MGKKKSQKIFFLVFSDVWSSQIYLNTFISNVSDIKKNKQSKQSYFNVKICFPKEYFVSFQEKKRWKCLKFSLVFFSNFDIWKNRKNVLGKKNEIFRNSPRKTFSMKGNFFFEKKDFKEVFMPQYKPKENQIIAMKVSFFPCWIKPFFETMSSFNYIQTITFSTSFGTDNNLLLCSPTGTGKTTIALFCILRNIMNSVCSYLPKRKIIKNQVKILYLAPMRSLVREIGKNFNKLFQKKGLKVLEATGENEISEKEMKTVNILIGTPEKIDFFSRKENSKIHLKTFKLIIVDEIHLLNEKRGSILEEILIRFLSNLGNKKLRIRVIGLSATLPNFHDIGTFLKVNPSRGLFYFGSKFRPINLDKTIIGLKKTLFSPFILFSFNKILISRIKKIFQKNPSANIIVFVHSRRDTIKTGTFLSDKLEFFGKFKKKKEQSNFDQKKKKIKSKEIGPFLEKGIGIHHAGLLKKDRNKIEGFFRDGNLSLIISTATLAWGLNLPATHVIIKGTKIYSPEKSSWIEISDLNIIQMFGRAGRKIENQFSEGILITTSNNLGYYFNLFNNQLPIESRLLESLPDCLLTECNGKRITNINSGIKWFSKTYFWIRLRRSILRQSIFSSTNKKKIWLISLENLFISETLNELMGTKMIFIEKKKGLIKNTLLGKISCDFKVSYQTVVFLLSQISHISTYSDIFRLVSLSGEFSSFQIRKGEKNELFRLDKLIFYPSIDDSAQISFKVNILLQSYIRRLIIENLSLEADSVFIGRTSLRVSRALFEISITKRLANLSITCFRIYKAIKTRIWSIFDSLPQSFWGLEKKETFLNLSKKKFFARKTQSLESSKKNKINYNKRKNFERIKIDKSPPSLKISFFLQPITRNTLQIHFFIILYLRRKDPKKKISGFWIFLEDQLCDTIIFFSYMKLKIQNMEKKLQFSIQIPLFDNPPSPYFFLRIISDNLIGSELEFSIDLTRVFFPKNFPIETSPFGLKPSNPARIFSGLKGGLVLLEYFLTHFCKLNPFLFQISPYLFKKTGKKILMDYRKNIKVLFTEFCILSYFLSTKFFTGVIFSCGTEGINLKTLTMRKNSTSIIGLPVTRIYKENLFKKKKKLYLRILFILSPNEYLFFREKIIENISPYLAFFTDSFHLIGNWNFGNSLERTFEYWGDSSENFRKIFISGTLFPVFNFWDLLEWLQMGLSQAFCKNLKIKKNTSLKNQVWINQNGFLISKKRKHLPSLLNWKINFLNKKKEKSLAISPDLNNLKKISFLKFFSFLTPSNFQILSNPLFFGKSFESLWEGKKIPKLFSLLGIGWVDFSKSALLRSLIKELFNSRKMNIILLTFGSIATFDLESLVEENELWIFQLKPFRNSKSSVVLFSKHRRSQLLQISDQKIFSLNCNFLVLESLWDVWFIENFLNVLKQRIGLQVKNYYIQFLNSFFWIRLFRNPNFYNVSRKELQNFSINEFIKTILKIFIEKKLIFLISKKKIDMPKKTKNFFGFGLFHPNLFFLCRWMKKNKNGIETLKKFYSKYFTHFVKQNQFLFSFYTRIPKQKKKFKKKNGVYPFKIHSNLIQLIKFGLNWVISILLNVFSFKMDLESVLMLLRCKQSMIFRNFEKKSVFYVMFKNQNLMVFLLGKVHNIYSIENLYKLLFSNLGLNILSEFQKLFFFRNFFLEKSLDIHLLIIRNKKKKKIKFQFNFFRKKFFSYFSNILEQKNQCQFKDQNFWWIIIGDRNSNRIFWYEKLKNFKGKKVEIQFNSKEKYSQIKVFAINEFQYYLDREAFFSFDYS